MAKKVIARLQKGEGKGFTKVIRMVKSEKTDAYVFKENYVAVDAVKEFLNKNKK